MWRRKKEGKNKEKKKRKKCRVWRIKKEGEKKGKKKKDKKLKLRNAITIFLQYFHNKS